MNIHVYFKFKYRLQELTKRMQQECAYMKTRALKGKVAEIAWKKFSFESTKCWNQRAWI